MRMLTFAKRCAREILRDPLNLAFGLGFPLVLLLLLSTIQSNAPVSLFEIVMGKFLGAFILYAMCVAIFLLYTLVICFFTAPQWSVILCTMFGMLLLGGALIAIDIFISALTESQVVSAFASIAVALFISLVDVFTNITNSQFVINLINAISFNKNYTNFTYGILDFSNVIFFVSVIAIFVFLTIRVFEKKRWN